MPEQNTIERAARQRRKGRAASTQAGEFVREEMRHIRGGKHGARSTKQAIAIGLSQARRAGVDLPPPKEGKVSERTRRSAELAYESGQGKRPRRRPSRTRQKAILLALKREPRRAASPLALARQAHAAAGRRSAAERSEAALEAVRTKGPAERSAAARTRARQ